MSRNKTFKTTTAVLALVGALASPALAQEVRLIGKESNINVTGKLLSDRGGKFLVETDIGEFVIDQSLVTCEGDACPSSDAVSSDLKLAGTDELAKVLVPILVEGFAATNLDAEVELLDADGEVVDTEESDASANKFGEENYYNLQVVDYEGEDVANFGLRSASGKRLFEVLAQGDASIAFTATPARKKDRAVVADGGGGNLRAFDQERVIAVDGYAMVVNPLNGVPSISVKQARNVMTGKIKNWSELGGADAPINVYSFGEDTEGYNHIKAMLFRKKKKGLTSDATIVEDKTELTTSIMDDVAGFGIVNFSSKRGTRAVPVESRCGLIQEPTAFNIKTEEYALQQRVIAYNRSDIDGYGRELLDYMDTEALDGLVAKAGLIDLSISSDPQTLAAERLAAELEEGENEYEAELVEDLLKNMNTHERLSTTFRFAPGSKRFDNKAERDVARVIKFIGETKPTEVVVVGFTDNKGPFDPNLLISQDRAGSVLEHLKKMSKNGELEGISLSAQGYGELQPVSCNDSPRGRATNRRVEVWIKK